MNYEKAYKEALEIARKINNGDGVATPADWSVCETIFPVLREDYDDMIRGAIIDHLKDNNLTEWADWLEKQKSNDVLDKEGRRQSNCKFNVGDIVKHSLYDGFYYIVKSIDDLEDYYELRCLNGNSANNIAVATEEYLSLWTIEDAKPGDVLIDGNMFVIFKSNNYDPNTQYGCMSVYCSMLKNNGGWHEFWYESGGYNPTNYLPANRKQRRYFFKRMKDAGYEFDFKKKELKKI